MAHLREATAWLGAQALQMSLAEIHEDRLLEVDRISQNVDLSLTERLARAPESGPRAGAAAVMTWGGC